MSRTRATAKKAGTAWETAIVNTLIACGWPHAERRRLSGAFDKGDVSGVLGVVIEAKNTAAFTPAAFLDEAEIERVNARADVGVAWIKRRGKSDPLAGYVLMSGQQFLHLLREAGY